MIISGIKYHYQINTTLKENLKHFAWTTNEVIDVKRLKWMQKTNEKLTRYYCRHLILYRPIAGCSSYWRIDYDSKQVLMPHVKILVVAKVIFDLTPFEIYRPIQMYVLLYANITPCNWLYTMYALQSKHKKDHYKLLFFKSCMYWSLHKVMHTQHFYNRRGKKLVVLMLFLNLIYEKWWK